MKQIYLFTLAFLSILVSYAQIEGASKLYGYIQKQTPGTVRVDDNGNERPRQQQYNYYIYLASSVKVVSTEIWINGEPFSLTCSQTSSPVQYKHPNSTASMAQTLVPKTDKKVLQLSPTANRIEKPSAKGKSLASKNQLVVIYKANNKFYYKTLSKLKELDPVMMQ